MLAVLLLVSGHPLASATPEDVPSLPREDLARLLRSKHVVATSDSPWEAVTIRQVRTLLAKTATPLLRHAAFGSMWPDVGNPASTERLRDVCKALWSERTWAQPLGRQAARAALLAGRQSPADQVRLLTLLARGYEAPWFSHAVTTLATLEDPVLQCIAGRLACAHLSMLTSAEHETQLGRWALDATHTVLESSCPLTVAALAHAVPAAEAPALLRPLADHLRSARPLQVPRSGIHSSVMLPEHASATLGGSVRTALLALVNSPRFADFPRFSTIAAWQTWLVEASQRANLYRARRDLSPVVDTRVHVQAGGRVSVVGSDGTYGFRVEAATMEEGASGPMFRLRMTSEDEALDQLMIDVPGCPLGFHPGAVVRRGESGWSHATGIMPTSTPGRYVVRLRLWYTK